MFDLNGQLNNEKSIRYILKSCINLVRLYDWLLDLYVVDFYVDDHWNRLPAPWKESLLNIDPQELGKIILGHQTKHILPLSLLALLKTAKFYSISRKPIHKNTFIRDKNMLENVEPIKNSFKGHPKLKNLFLKHVKLKKRHEIHKMAEVVAEVAKGSGSKAVIDFGSGLGHLARILSYKHGLSAVGIESQHQLTKDASKLDKELEYTARKYLTEDLLAATPTPYHINLTLSSLKEIDSLEVPKSLKTNYGLIGLHPCGDLGPLIIKHFIESSEVSFICVVGCCYMKLTCEEEGGYPLSEYLKEMKWFLSYQSREISCHSIEVYCGRLCDGNYGDLKIHAFRGVLEKLLVELDPELKHSPVRSIKHSENMDFHQYCTLATERLGVQIPWSDAIGSRVESMLSLWKRVVVVYTLRLVLAPIIETIILLDRVLFILEKGLSCEILPVFDPKISPRNHIIIGRRL